MIRLFPRSKAMLALCESLAFLIATALYHDGKSWTVCLGVWVVLALLAYVGVSAYAVKLNGKLLGLLLVYQKPDDFLKIYEPLLKTPHLRKNVLFRMRSWLVTAQIAAGRFPKALELLDGMEILPGRVADACRGVIASSRCSVYLWQNRLPEALEQLELLKSLGDRAKVSPRELEILQARLSLAEGRGTRQLADTLRQAMKEAKLPLLRNERKLWLGQCYLFISEKALALNYLKEAATCPKELALTRRARELLGT